MIHNSITFCNYVFDKSGCVLVIWKWFTSDWGNHPLMAVNYDDL